MAKHSGPVIHSQKEAFEKEQLTKFLTEDLTSRQDETRSVLDALRRSRKSRGGVGAPLQVPAHLAGGPIIVTDDDLKPSRPISEQTNVAIEEALAPGVVDGEE